MLRARGQAEHYARALPDEYPPFLVVVDVGHCIELYADFSRTGKTYTHFPDATRFRIRLDDLADPAIRDRLAPRLVRPRRPRPRPHRRPRHPRDRRPPRRARPTPSRRRATPPTASPTSSCAASSRCSPRTSACIPENSFRDLLEVAARHPRALRPDPRRALGTMNTGGFSARAAPRRAPLQRRPVRRHRRAAARQRCQLDLLIEAAGADWRDVEPAIFGTLLERALDPASATSSAPTTRRAPTSSGSSCPPSSSRCAPSGTSVHAAAVRLGRRRQARRGPRPRCARFHHQLCETRVLDPACGTGNFLYVTLEHMKRLEGEVLDAAHASFGETQSALDLAGHTVDPHQFLGIEAQPARRRHRRPRALDRLPAMALPHPRPRRAGRAGAAGTSTTSNAATPCWPGTRPKPRLDARRQARHPLGRPHHQDAPRHRRGSARRNRRVPVLATPTRAPPNGPRPISSSATRRSSATSGCAQPSATATPKRCGSAYPKVPKAPTS